MIELLKKILKWCTPYGFFLYKEKLQQNRRQLNADYLHYQKEFLPKLKSHHLVLFKDNSLNVFGQGGEDLLLRAYMNEAYKTSGFYIDIGAFHPVQASNTKYFYDRGWRGINIEANPESAVLFNKMRPRDINLNIGVSDENSNMEYYFFGPEHSINTFNERQAAAFSQHFQLPIKEVISMPVRHINEVLHENIPVNQKIDFLSLDIEGLEQKILQAIDFETFRPSYLLIEDITLEGNELDFENWQKLQQSLQHQFVEAQGYELLGKSPLTLLYKRTNL
jgi:FkbM family methyltransferase